jgi:hypothetical protein
VKTRREVRRTEVGVGEIEMPKQRRAKVDPIRAARRRVVVRENAADDDELKYDFPLDDVEDLAAIGSTFEEIAMWFGVDYGNVSASYARDPEFRDAVDRGAANIRVSIRRRQIQGALEGNASLLIWLGKTMLGQQDAGRADPAGMKTKAAAGAAYGHRVAAGSKAAAEIRETLDGAGVKTAARKPPQLVVDEAADPDSTPVRGSETPQ